MAFSLVNRMSALAIRSSTYARSQITKPFSTTALLQSSSSQLTTRASSTVNLESSPSFPISQTFQCRNQGLIHNNCNKNVSLSLQSITIRDLSTAAAIKSSSSSMLEDGTVIATGPDGSKYSIPLKPLGKFNQVRHAPKIAPRIVNSRIKKLRTVVGNKKRIRHSPWRLNLVCQFAARETYNVEDAMEQLEYVNKVKAPLVRSVIQNTANSAKVKYGLLPSQLEVAECFTTQATHIKRIKRMGRGRAGKMYRRHSHIRVVLREIDFPLKIMQSTSWNQRKKWVKMMDTALQEQAEYMAEKEEIEALERAAEEAKKKKEE